MSKGEMDKNANEFDEIDEESLFGEFALTDNLSKRKHKEPTTQGRFGEVSSLDVLSFLENNVNINTKKKTKGDIDLLMSFLETKNESRKLEFIPPSQLNDYLSAFLLAVRKKDGGEYEPCTLQSFISSIDRYLKTNGYKTSLRGSIEFSRTMEVLKMKTKQLKSLGKGNKPKAADPLEDTHIQKMFDSGTLGDSRPSSLIHSLWLLCTTNFGMRTGQEVHSLRWGDVQCKEDEIGEYLIYDTERQTKTRTGANVRDTRLTKPRTYAVPGTNDKDPVHIYKIFAAMRPVEMLVPESSFFLSVANKTPKPGQPWYKKQSMGINKLYGIMKEMKADAGIECEKRITPYSARKHLIQKLNDEGVPPHQIVQISGHKNINSLNSYSKLNPHQSKAISDMLSKKDESQTLTIPTLPVPQQSAQNNAPGLFPISYPMFMGATFNGPVSFHFESKSQSVTHSQTAVCNESSSPRRFKRIKYFSDPDSE